MAPGFLPGELQRVVRRKPTGKPHTIAIGAGAFGHARFYADETLESPLISIAAAQSNVPATAHELPDCRQSALGVNP
jgi:hypothetical protein